MKVNILKFLYNKFLKNTLEFPFIFIIEWIWERDRFGNCFIWGDFAIFVIECCSWGLKEPTLGWIPSEESTAFSLIDYNHNFAYEILCNIYLIIYFLRVLNWIVKTLKVSLIFNIVYILKRIEAYWGRIFEENHQNIDSILNFGMERFFLPQIYSFYDYFP